MLFNPLLDRPHAQILWDYNQMKQPLKPADFIFVLCSYNLDIADYADILFMQKMGKFIAVSGGMGHKGGMLRMPWDEPESHVFKERLIELGNKENNLVIEDQSRNTGENIQFTKKLLEGHDPELKTGLIVQKPYMERRAYAAAMKQWPEIEWQVTSPTITYDDYIEKFDEERLINIIVGDTWRIKEYAKQGYQIPQEMPDEVETSLKELIKKGYTKHIDS